MKDDAVGIGGLPGRFRASEAAADDMNGFHDSDVATQLPTSTRQRPRRRDQRRVARRDYSRRQAQAVLEADPRTEPKTQRLAIDRPLGRVRPVQQTRQDETGSIEDRDDGVGDARALVGVLLVDFDQRAQASRGERQRGEAARIRDRPRPASTPTPFFITREMISGASSSTRSTET